MFHTKRKNHAHIHSRTSRLAFEAQECDPVIHSFVSVEVRFKFHFIFLMIESNIIALTDDFYEFQSNSSKRNQPGRFDDFDEFSPSRHFM